MPYTTNKKVLDAVTASTLSSEVTIGDRDLKSIQFLCTGAASGVATATVQVSNDNLVWFTYKRLISNVAAGTATTTVSLDTLGNSKAIYFFPGGDTFQYLRVNFSLGSQTGATFTATLQGVIAGQ